MSKEKKKIFMGVTRVQVTPSLSFEVDAAGNVEVFLREPGKETSLRLFGVYRIAAVATSEDGVIQSSRQVGFMEGYYTSEIEAILSKEDIVILPSIPKSEWASHKALPEVDEEGEEEVVHVHSEMEVHTDVPTLCVDGEMLSGLTQMAVSAEVSKDGNVTVTRTVSFFVGDDTSARTREMVNLIAGARSCGFVATRVTE